MVWGLLSLVVNKWGKTQGVAQPPFGTHLQQLKG